MHSAIIGIDVARAFAIIGMLAVHTGPTVEPIFAGQLYALPHGRSLEMLLRALPRLG